MGVQIIGTFTGMTNGQVTTIDNTLEFLAIAESIDTLNFNIGMQLAAMNTFNTSFWSPAGLATPGAPIAVLAAQGKALNNISAMMASMM